MRSNTNPLYLTEFVGTVAGLVGLGGLTATGIKYGRMKYNANKLIQRYPTPDHLRQALLKLNNPTATKLASHLDLMSTEEDYYNFVQRYLCGNSTGKWIANALIPGAFIYQGAKAISDTSEPTYDKLVDAAS